MFFFAWKLPNDFFIFHFNVLLEIFLSVNIKNSVNWWNSYFDGNIKLILIGLPDSCENDPLFLRLIFLAGNWLFNWSIFYFHLALETSLTVDIESILEQYNSYFDHNKKLISFKLIDSCEIVWQFEKI